MTGTTKYDYAAFATGNTFAYEMYKISRGSKGRDPLYVDANEVRTLASRGSYAPLLIGRRRLEPIFAWAGSREVTVTTQRAGGKGGGGTTGGPQSTSYKEAAWHVLCVGPADQLHRIYVSGKIVWEGPITRDDSPSGTSINIPNVGTFTIYWGEDTQPVNAFLADGTRVGVSSRWPNLCYVQWENFQLGSTPSWPIIGYDIETKIEDVYLTATTPSSDNVPGPGVNLAHAIAQLLFAPFPRGLGRDQSLYDLQSLEDVGLAVSSPASTYIPFPINAILFFNYDAATVGTVIADANGYVDEWQPMPNIFPDGGTLPPSEITDQTLLPVQPNRRPVFYDGEGTIPQGLTDRGQALLNECPGVYFNSDFLDILESAGTSVSTGIVGTTTELGIIAAITVYATGEGGLGGVLQRIGCVFGFWDDQSPPPNLSGETNPVPLDTGGLHLAAGNADQAGPPDEFIVRASVVQDNDPLPNTELFAQIQSTPQPVTMIVTLRYENLGGGNGLIEVSASTVNGGNVVSATAPVTLDTVNRIVMGGFRSDLVSSAPDYYLDAVVHQVVGIYDNVLQVDMDLYVDWLRRRWGNCGQDSDARAFSTNAIGANGNSAGELLGQLLRDGSVGMRWNSEVGKFQFIPFRANSEVVIVPEGYITGAPAQVSTEHLREFPDKLVFSFVDVDHGFQKQTITIDSDGVADFETFARAKEINLPTVVDFDSAEAISNRRVLEELDTKLRIALEMNHEGRIYYPGTVLSVPNYNFLLRVVELTLTKRSQGRSGNARLVCLPDVYGASEYFSFGTPSGTGDDAQPIQPEPDVVFGTFELPEQLIPTPNSQLIIVPRVRANAQVGYAAIYLSDDGISYNSKGLEFDFQVGGTLDGPLDADTLFELDQEPTITIQGVPDTVVLEDLSTQISLWRGGSQLVLIGGEIFFLRNLASVGGLTYRMEGLIRARYDTVRETHPAGSQVFILRSDQVLPVADSIVLSPGNTIFTKTQPVASVALDLSLVAADSVTLYGKGIRPPAPSQFRVYPAHSFSFLSGEDIEFRWAYSTNGAGAGTVLAGVPHTAPLPDMTFEFEVWDQTFTTIYRTELLGISPTYTYTNADRLADLGVEGTFGVRLYSRRNGYRSAVVERVVALVP